MTSDDRMLPDSLRGYAPVVRGIANSNARVTVLQGKSQLYETTVAPGPFAIDDLFATNFSGDLTVVVTEADGSVSTFTVPFSAVPQSMRPGSSRYSATLGRSRFIGDNDLFSELTWQYGLSNSVTFNAGNQLADGYQALMLGGVYSNSLGLLAWIAHFPMPACRKAIPLVGCCISPIVKALPQRIPRFPSPGIVTPPKGFVI